MKKKDPIRDFLEEKGCPEHVCEGGDSRLGQELGADG